MIVIMDPQRRALVALALQEDNNQLTQLILRRRRRRERSRRTVWVRPWIARRMDLGLYDRLMGKLRNEDPRAFQNFMRMTPALFDELVERLSPRSTKPSTNFRASLDPGLKVAITLRHLASGNKYHSMQYGWRVPHNTISIIVRDVCNAIFDEYTDEMMTTPNTEEGWRTVADDWYQ